jgi:ABC-type polysaccharide/polyol phosphate export permease
LGTAVYTYISGRSNWSRAMGDLANAWRRRRLWSGMALREFRNQYRGALLGPFWVSLTTAMTAAGLGVLYGQLFGRPLTEHVPYVTVALVAWALISNLLTSGADIFVGSAYQFKEFPIPLSLYPMKMVLAQMIISVFRLVVLLGVILLFQLTPQWEWLLAPIGLLLVFWIGFWASLAIGTINARFRDFGQLIAASMSFLFFVTPVFWEPSRLGEYSIFVTLNPFYHLIQTVRGPLLGHEGLLLNFAVTGGIALLVTIVGTIVFGRFSHRLPYWC